MMSHSDTFPLSILLLTILSWISYRLHSLLTDDLRSLPGPFLARFTRLWYLRAVHKGNFEQQNILLHRKHGPIVRLGPDMYSFSEQDAINQIYGTQKVFPKSGWYSTFQQPCEPNIFSTNNNRYAAEVRKKYKPVYDVLLSYEGAVDNCATLLEQKLSEIALKGEAVDIGWWLTCYAFDVNGEISFGERFGHLDEGIDIGGIATALAERLDYVSHVGIYPSLHPIFWKLISAMVFITKQVDYTYVFAEKQIEAHQNRQPKDESDSPDMLSRYLAEHWNDPEHFTKNDVLIGAYTGIVAGADTTWISLGSVLYFLHKHPHTLQTLRDEIEDFNAKGKISDPITFNQAKQMPYVNAVIKEAQRMHSPTGLPLWRVTPEPGVTICGTYFKPGVTVGVNTWVAHRSAAFQPDGDTFRPERWLEARKDELMHMNASFIPFGAGPRVCTGQALALMEMSKVIPQLVRKFEFDLPKSWETHNHWLVGHKGLKGSIRLRHSESDA